MNRARRRLLMGTGGGLAALGLSSLAPADEPVVVEMRGTARGERVWFAPVGVAIAVGTVIRFVNRDVANSHTATTYHPGVYDRRRRIPAAAQPWNSGFLLAGEVFRVRLRYPGVYDYYCIPHERAGMAGRIVVGTPDDPAWEPAIDGTGGVPEAVAAALPPVEAILGEGRIDPEA